MEDYQINVNDSVEFSISFDVCFSRQELKIGGFFFNSRSRGREVRIKLPSEDCEFLMAIRSIGLPACLAGNNEEFVVMLDFILFALFSF